MCCQVISEMGDKRIKVRHLDYLTALHQNAKTIYCWQVTRTSFSHLKCLPMCPGFLTGRENFCNPLARAIMLTFNLLISMRDKRLETPTFNEAHGCHPRIRFSPLPILSYFTVLSQSRQFTLVAH